MSWQVWDVEYLPAAIRDLERLDKQVARRVLDAVRNLAATGQGSWKPLTDRGRERSLRVGDWRVIFVFDAATRQLSVLRVLPRGRAYQR
ncbi:MAG: type II toxin-antitoxin system RelE/ParE family toxin [Chloroflexi bacterium]|nr:type II toxin-antitoxin system RelE/ParE family toxin [Chloroflexota bacterium]